MAMRFTDDAPEAGSSPASDPPEAEVIGEVADLLHIYVYQRVLVELPCRVHREEVAEAVREIQQRLASDQWLVVVDPKAGTSTTVELAEVRQHLAALVELANTTALEITASTKRVLAGAEQTAHALRALQLQHWAELEEYLRRVRESAPGSTFRDVGDGLADFVKKWMSERGPGAKEP